MVFSSLEFIYLFLMPTLAVFIFLRHYGWEKGIIWWLITASLIFYAWWSVTYLLLLLTSVVVNFLIHKQLLKTPSRLILGLGTAANLAALGYFKYADFLIANLNLLANMQLPLLNVILPLAISFFTFQQISFLFDTYHKKIEYCDFSKYCLFVVFFPQLIAGPIVLQKHTIPQFNMSVFNKSVFNNLSVGLTLFGIGLFKKVVLADSMAPIANQVFNLAHEGHAIPTEAAWLGILAYSFQIYFDFSGYCDMALGLARLFGITLPINFNSPYQALNIVDFWRRWHMTLSAFLRDYLYIPFGGSRNGKLRQYAALMATMLLGGLWHGASWNFVFWGMLHGAYLTINHGWTALTKNSALVNAVPPIIARVLSHGLTMLAVMIAWVFFRAENFSDAILVLDGMAGNAQLYSNKLWSSLLAGSSEIWLQLFALSLIVVFLPNSIELTKNFKPVLNVKHVLRKAHGLSKFIKRTLVWQPSLSWSIAVLLMTSTSLFYLYHANRMTEFIYFNF